MTGYDTIKYGLLRLPLKGEKVIEPPKIVEDKLKPIFCFTCGAILSEEEKLLKKEDLNFCSTCYNLQSKYLNADDGL